MDDDEETIVVEGAAAMGGGCEKVVVVVVVVVVGVEVAVIGVEALGDDVRVAKGERKLGDAEDAIEVAIGGSRESRVSR